MDLIPGFLAANPEIVIIYQIVRGLAVFLIIVFAFVTIYSLYQLRKYKPKFVWYPPKWERYVKPRKNKKEALTPVVTSAWSKLRSKLNGASPDTYRLAIIEADGIVDEVLRRMELSGETFAERLAHLSSERYPSLEKLWDAHRVRNNLVHTPDFKVSPTKAEEAIQAYEGFLKEVKAL